MAEKVPAVWRREADFLIEEDIPRLSSINKELTINVFLQEWGLYTSQKFKLPMDIKRMLHVMKKYNVWVDTLVIPAKVQRHFLAWYSRGAERPSRGFMSKETTKCLIKNHKIRKVKHLMKSSERLRNNTQGQHH